MAGDQIVAHSPNKETLESADHLARHLEVGAVAVLEINPHSGNPSHVRTHIRGWLEGQYVLVDRTAATAGMMFRPGQICALRFIKDGVVQALYAPVFDKYKDKTDRVLALRWPLRVSCLSLRRHERAQVTLPCMALTADGSSIRATIEDLSVGGGCLRADYSFDVGAMFEITFVLPTGEVIEEVPVTVQNRSLADEGGGHRFGCKFAEISPEDSAAIEIFVTHTLGERREHAAPGPILALAGPAIDLAPLHLLAHQERCCVIAAASFAELCLLVRIHVPQAIFVHAHQRELSPVDMCRILRNALPKDFASLVVFGGDGQLASQAVDGGFFYMKELSSDLPLVHWPHGQACGG